MRISTFFIRVGGTECSYGKIPARLPRSRQRLPRSRLVGQACSYDLGNRDGPLSEISAHSYFLIKNFVVTHMNATECYWSRKRCRHLGKRVGIFPYEHSIPPTGMKNFVMRMRRRGYVIEFSNFQVDISIMSNLIAVGRMKTIIWTQEKFISLSGSARLPGSCERPLKW